MCFCYVWLCSVIFLSAVLDLNDIIWLNNSDITSIAYTSTTNIQTNMCIVVFKKFQEPLLEKSQTQHYSTESMSELQ